MDPTNNNSTGNNSASANPVNNGQIANNMDASAANPVNSTMVNQGDTPVANPATTMQGQAVSAPGVGNSMNLNANDAAMANGLGATNTNNVSNATSQPSTALPGAMNPVNSDALNAALNPPVNPVVTPGAANAGGSMPMNQMFQSQPMNTANVFDETTAIAVPEGPKPPDPVEEELKAPLKPVGPVPGSIGSAVSMPPTDGGQAAANGAPMDGTNNQMATANTPSAKKPSFLDKMTTKTKMSKSTLILLSVVAGLVVVSLVVILVLAITGVL